MVNGLIVLSKEKKGEQEHKKINKISKYIESKIRKIVWVFPDGVI